MQHQHKTEKIKKEEVNIVRIQKNEQKENTYNIDSNLVSNNKKETTHSTSPITSLFRNSRRRKQSKKGSTNSNLITINKNDIIEKKDKETHTGTWKRVLISEYDPATDTFNGNIDDENKTEFKKMPKVFILFDAENPYVYAKRVAEAVRLRNENKRCTK